MVTFKAGNGATISVGAVAEFGRSLRTAIPGGRGFQVEKHTRPDANLRMKTAGITISVKRKPRREESHRVGHRQRSVTPFQDDSSGCESSGISFAAFAGSRSTEFSACLPPISTISNLACRRHIASAQSREGRFATGNLKSCCSHYTIDVIRSIVIVGLS